MKKKTKQSFFEKEARLVLWGRAIKLFLNEGIKEWHKKRFRP
jgi:hypothetical protein